MEGTRDRMMKMKLMMKGRGKEERRMVDGGWMDEEEEGRTRKADGETDGGATRLIGSPC